MYIDGYSVDLIMADSYRPKTYSFTFMMIDYYENFNGDAYPSFEYGSNLDSTLHVFSYYP